MKAREIVTKGIVYSMAAVMLVAGAPINVHAEELQETVMTENNSWMECGYEIFTEDVWQYVLIDTSDAASIQEKLLAAFDDSALDVNAGLTSIQFPGRNQEDGALVIEKDIVLTLLNKLGFTNEDTGRMMKFIIDDVEIRYSSLAAASDANSNDMFYKNLAEDAGVVKALQGVYGSELPTGVCFGSTVNELPAGKELSRVMMTLPVKNDDFYMYQFDGEQFELKGIWVTYDNGNGESLFSANVSEAGTFIMVNEQLPDSLVKRDVMETVILSQPQDMTVAEGGKAVFSVEAEGEGLTYQWYKCKIGQGWEPMTSKSGKTAKVSFTAKGSLDGMAVYCAIVDAYGNQVDTDMVCLTVKTPLAITKQPANTTVAPGEKAMFHVEAKGTYVTYQWEKCKNGQDWEPLTSSSGKTADASFTVRKSLNGMEVRCVVTDVDGNSVVTEEATLTVKEPIVIAVQPKDTTVILGEKASFHVEAEGEGLTYQWYKCKTNQGWEPMTSKSAKTDTVTFTATSGLDGMVVYCSVMDAEGHLVDSKMVCLTVKTPLQITKQPTNAVAANNSKIKFSIGAKGDYVSYQWQKNKNGVWENLNTATGTTANASFTMRTSLDGMKVRCIVTNADGKQMISNTVTANVLR